MKHFSAQGSLMSEYGLIMALVAVAGIAGYAALGSGVTDLFTSFKAPGPPPTYTASNVGLLGQPSGNGQTSGTASNNGTAGNVGFARLPDGTMLNLGNYPVILSKAVETSGVNGTTEQLLGSLESLIAKLVADGKLTPAQASAYNKLANAGHNLADAEKLIENTMTSCGSNISCLQNTPVVFKGQTYGNLVAFETANIGFWETCESPGVCSNPTPTLSSLNSTGIQTNGWRGISGDFAQEYSALQSQGMLADPDMNKIVTALSTQILLMSDTLETTSGKTAVNDNPDFTPENYASNIISGVTEYDSASICSVGGGTDSGVKCQ